MTSPSSPHRQDHPAAATKKSTSVLRSIIAGSMAGGIEIAITYPAEFAKTRTQLNRRLAEGQKLPWPPFGRQWYAGCVPMIAGNSLKAGIRFVAFDQFKRLLADRNGKLSGPRTVIAGFGAGFTESLLAVTPTEAIKTMLIEDKKSGNPRFRSLLHAIPTIARERGLGAFFQGFAPTTARQAANSAVRFTAYNSLKQAAEGVLVTPGEKLGWAASFAIGSVAGFVTVYATQPIDTVKTRMQTLEARTTYGNSLKCAVMIIRQEGLRTFWSGAVYRLGRLMLSGGIVFAGYEKCMEVMNKIDPEGRIL